MLSYANGLQQILNGGDCPPATVATQTRLQSAAFQVRQQQQDAGRGVPWRPLQLTRNMWPDYS